MESGRATIATIFGHQENADQFGTEEEAMVKERVDSLVWLRKQIENADKDLLQEMVKAMLETLMSAEADTVCGAPYRKPSPSRVNRRNGYR